MTRTIDRLRVPLALAMLFTVMVSIAGPQTASAAPPTFSKAFAPDTIGPGSVSTLTFTITNADVVAIADLAFSDALPVVPGAVTIADPANTSNDCDGTLTAPSGGGTISLSEGKLGVGETCTITVDVTASTPGVHTNLTGDLTSSEGNSGTATADLTVTTTLPGFSKSFAPSSVSLGGRSTLTFTIDNTQNASPVGTLDFADSLPIGMVVASPANSSTNCVSATILDTTLIADSGSSIITLDADGSTILPGYEVLGAGGTCTVIVEVVTTGAGVLGNSSGELLADFVTAGKANASLTATRADLHLSKEFTDDPTPPGGTSTLEFTIDNFDRFDAATGVAFTDDLAAALGGLTYTSLLSNDCGGTVAGVGTTTVTVTGGTVTARGSCTIRVAVSVPPAATPGDYVNTTGTVSGTVTGSPVTGNAASDTLFVSPAPILTKEFLESGTLALDPVVEPGDDVVIRFTVTNTSTTSGATDVTFLDELTDGGPETGFLPFPVTVTLPPVPDPPCGAGSSVALVSAGEDRQALELTGGSLAAAPGAGATCSFDVTVTIPATFPPGVYLNTTEEPSATVDGATRVGLPASDTLTVVSAPQLTKTFADDPVAPGETVTLEFTLSHGAEESGVATGVGFTDDLTTVLAGLTASGLPLLEACDPDGPGGDPGTGTVSASAGDTLLTFAGGALAPGESCTFSVTLDVPAAALAGTYGNATSGVSATVGGKAVTSAPSSDDLVVSGLRFSKEFLTDPAIAGETTTLRFTMENVSTTTDATITFFSDNLQANLPGLAASGPANFDDCGGSLSGTTFLIYSGGGVLAGESCTIEVPVLVPIGAADGAYANITSSLSANQGGAVNVAPAVDELTVNSGLLGLTKEFTDDPVLAGDPVTLDFTLTNLDATRAASGVGFTDDLTTALAGLTFDSVVSDDCSGTVSGTGTTTITVAGVSLAASGACTISVSLTVPGAAADGVYTNTTSIVDGTIAGLAVNGSAASDDLDVTTVNVSFSKTFDGPTTATGTSVLTFTIDNLDSVNPIGSLAFVDDLDAVVSGLVADSSSPTPPCGPGSAVAGTSIISLSDGSIPAGGSCSFDVTVSVPGTASVGTFPNTTSGLFSGGLAVADPATADLVIEPPPTFAKVFAPDTIFTDQVSTLTFTIDNTASAVAASSVAFTDVLPAGIDVPSPPTVTSVGCGPPFTGLISTDSGTDTITYTNGTVPAGGTCTINVDVVGESAGAHVNTTGDLTSSSGNSGTATDTLNVNPRIPPTFTKAFTPDATVVSQVTTLTFIIDNGASTLPASALEFADPMPAGVVVATPSNKANTCTGGMVDATDGGNSVGYSGGEVAAGATCTITVDVTATSIGAKDNLTGDLTSSSGNSGTAADTLTVTPIIPPTFAKAFAPDTIIESEVSTLTFTIDNTASAVAATGLGFTDNLPAGVEVSTPSNKANTCTGGMVDATDGGNSVGYSGGEVAAGATCTITVDVTAPLGTAGTKNNLTGDLTSSSGNSGTAADTLTVTALIAPTFAKTFAPDTIDAGAVSTLTFTIDNTASAVAATGLGFTDNLPAGVEVSTPSNKANTCTGGIVVAIDGTSVISYSGGEVAPGASCTITVDVTAAADGVYPNTTGGLTSSSGSSGTASDTLHVNSTAAFTSVDGSRFADTRQPGGTTFDGQFQAAGRRQPGSTYEVTIAGRGDVPANAIGAIVNLTAVGPSAPGFLTAFPCGSVPTASALNYTTGVDVANEIFAKLSPAGSLCVFTFAEADVLIDVVGYAVADDTVKLLVPARFAESRAGASTVDGQMEGFGRTTAGSTTNVQIAGRGNVPLGASAAIVNVAAIDPTDDSFVTVFPCSSPTPPTSSLNFTSGVNRSNELVAELSAAGELCVYTEQGVDLIVDVVAYVDDPSDLMNIGPSRFADSRGGPTVDGINSGGGPLGPGSTTEVQISGRDGVPANAVSAIVNVAAIDPLANGFFTVSGCVTPTPNASSLNYTTGVNGANELVVGLSAAGKLCVFTSAGSDVIIDVVGYVGPN